MAFLGNEADGSDKVIALIDTIADYHGNKRVCEELRDGLLHGGHGLEPGAWLALNKLALRSYWSRLWVIQELALGGSRTHTFCGPKSIGWTRFRHAVEVFHLYLWEVKTLRVQEDRKAKDPSDSKRWENTGPLHHIYKDLCAISQPEALTKKPLSLTRLLEISNFTSSTDPRDKVFGMLGIMPAELAEAIAVDYSQTADAGMVMAQAAKAYLAVYQNLEFLRDANAWGGSGAPS